MATYLITWNPAVWSWPEYESTAREIAMEGPQEFRWSLGGGKQVKAGDRLFLLRQGVEPKGIVGSGSAVGDWFADAHFLPERAAAGERTTYAIVRFDRLVDGTASPGSVLPVSTLNTLIPGLNTNVQQSGTRISEDIALAVEQMWQPTRRIYLKRDDAFPAGITREDVLGAIEWFRSHGYPLTFKDSTDYDVLHEGGRYPPKVLASLAARRLRGRFMFSDEFRGGFGTPCFRLLEDAGFQIAPKVDGAGISPSPDGIDDPTDYAEGTLRQAWVNVYERNPAARSACVAHYGCYCQVCGFNFEDRYGKLGAGFIHVHHLIPLSEICESYQVDPVRDLRPVCPNCHSMLHRQTPPFTIEELKSVVEREKSG